MQTQPVQLNHNRRGVAVAVSVAMALILMACGSIGSVTSSITTAATAAAGANSPAGRTPAPGTTPAPQAAAVQSSAQCQAIGAGYLDFEGEYPFLALGSDSAYASNTPDSPTYVNIAKLRSDLDLMATLPNGPLGKVSDSVAQFRQLVDLVDSNIKSGGHPFADGSGNGQKAIDLYLKLAVPYTVVAEAFAAACPDFSAATQAPDTAGFQIGQTAAVGDLRVTLDTVSEAPLDQNSLPTAGNRFLLFHVTIKNVGQAALQVTGMSETNLKDGAGNSYGYDPFTNSLAAAGGDGSMDGSIPPGGTHAGLVAYQLPANAGDLLWIFRDYGQNQAVFAVRASDIDTSSAGSAPTADAMRNQAGATMTALVGMAATQDAADLTGTPAP